MVYLFYVTQIAMKPRQESPPVATAKKRIAHTQKSPKNSPKKKGSKTAPDLRSKSEEKKVITIDRRKGDRRQKHLPVTAERRTFQRRAKVSRRRQIDPTTCERDYTQDEIEFMNAMDEYKRANGRMFPTCSEVLEVIRNLGYEKLPAQPPSETPAPLPINAETLVPPAAEAMTIF
jgi:hypothetical protein